MGAGGHIRSSKANVGFLRVKCDTTGDTDRRRRELVPLDRFLQFDFTGFVHPASQIWVLLQRPAVGPLPTN